MARMVYDRYLLDDENLVTISNADTDYLTDTVPASFINPPIKMRFLNTGDLNFEELCLSAVNDDENKISQEDVISMVRGELLGWRLVGAEFSRSGGFSAYYANENPFQTPTQKGKYSYIAAEGISFFFIEYNCLEVELEVDYADGLPARRYIGQVTHDDKTGVNTTIIEFLGKRKIRKIEFSEYESGDERIPGHLCYITEY